MTSKFKKENNSKRGLHINFLVTGIITCLVLLIGVFCVKGYVDVYSNKLETEHKQMEKEQKVNVAEQSLQSSLASASEMRDNMNNGRYNGTIDTLKFIVEVTDIKKGDTQTVVTGNTVMTGKYIGQIEIVYNNENIDIEIKRFGTYKFTTEPLMTMGDPVRVNMVSCVKASAKDKKKLENNKKRSSTYADRMLSYKGMVMKDIIKDANSSYYSWTDGEIKNYQAFLRSKGYKGKDSKVYTIKQLKAKAGRKNKL